MRRALSTAWYLRHRSGIAAVVAPLQTNHADVLIRVNHDWVVALYPHLDLEKSSRGAFGNDEDWTRAQQLVASIHVVAPSSLDVTPPAEDFTIPFRAEFFALLASNDQSWRGGPFAESARTLLERHAEPIRSGFARFDTLVGLAQERQEHWGITHGEPQAGNIVWRAERRDMVVVDWDTCAIAPRERDLWQLTPPHHAALTGLRPYLAATGLPETAVSADRLALYRLRWDLAEIAIYADQFSQEHVDSEDARVAWGGLLSSIGLLPNHLRQP